MAAFNWDDFLTLAERLVHDTEATESTWRTVSSRAYYAAYHRALMTAAHLDQNLNASYMKHEDLIVWYLLQTHNPLSQTIGQQLDTLKKMRVDADYHNQIPVNDRQAKFSIQVARKILKTLPHLISPGPSGAP
jgi:uncharacterized protein (UPF0332 family)